MAVASVIRVWRSRDRHCLDFPDQHSRQTGELRAQWETLPQEISGCEKSSKIPSVNLWLPHAHILTHKQTCTYKHINMCTRIYRPCMQSPKTVIYTAVFFLILLQLLCYLIQLWKGFPEWVPTPDSTVFVQGCPSCDFVILSPSFSSGGWGAAGFPKAKRSHQADALPP